jgi:hypothetical protein
MDYALDLPEGIKNIDKLLRGQGMYLSKKFINEEVVWFLWKGKELLGTTFSDKKEEQEFRLSSN